MSSQNFNNKRRNSQASIGSISFGYVYVIGNDAMPNLLKIGYTERTPEERAKELDGSSGIPYRFKVLFKKETINPYHVEQEAHKILHNKRSKKEWFQCTQNESIHAINEAYKKFGGTVVEIEEKREKEKIEEKRKNSEKAKFKVAKNKYEDQLQNYYSVSNKVENNAKELYPIEDKLLSALLPLFIMLLSPFIGFGLLGLEGGEGLIATLVCGGGAYLYLHMQVEAQKKANEDRLEYIKQSKEIAEEKARLEIAYNEFSLTYGTPLHEYANSTCDRSKYIYLFLVNILMITIINYIIL